MSKRFVLASGNAHKLREIGEVLAIDGCELIAQAVLGVAPPDEGSVSFVENALAKARHAAGATGLAAIADDSGLSVDALEGRPGVHSARYAGLQASDADNVTKLLAELTGVPETERAARYHCAIVLVRHALDPVPLICEGSWRGRIATAPRGSGGFGYDPIFWLPGRGLTAAELSPEEKNALSHRGQALRALAERMAAEGLCASSPPRCSGRGQA